MDRRFEELFPGWEELRRGWLGSRLYVCACGLCALRCPRGAGAFTTRTSNSTGNCFGGKQERLSHAWYFNDPRMAYLPGSTVCSGRTVTPTVKFPLYTLSFCSGANSNATSSPAG